ncbi:hypothetical protein WA1_07020 [Scytonema hofmannii PCC 7110]|uniref:Peptidase S8/S53 domain-containing protein n=1 Tax=Scytonema hofmannii PCC 7110 TaxID=128403 RepID=A0A139WT07_9CYAN|nr:S8 family serine peptidase [Scytonema hofmannii]KYC35568.1 hypothetical protein WA1_07020 [Scytonema hofmannii PCC 7110]
MVLNESSSEAIYDSIPLERNTSPISRDLLDLYEEFQKYKGDTPYYQGDTPDYKANAPFQSSNDLLLLDESSTRVFIKITNSNVTALLQTLKEFGFDDTGVAPEHNLLEGFLPIDSILDLKNLAEQRFSQNNSIPEQQNGEEQKEQSFVFFSTVETSQASFDDGGAVAGTGNGVTGKVTSQADIIQQASRVRNALPQGFDGSGVKVGVLSDSYNVLGTAQADIDSGDLPANVTVFQEGGLAKERYTDEGRAMLQLVYDLAPGADLSFSSVFLGEVNFAQQIRDLAFKKDHADILVDDFIYFDEPIFQDGIIAQAIDEVVTQYGVSYFSAAGNFNRQGYESTKFAGHSDSAGILAGTYHDFDPGHGVDTRQLITLAPNQKIVLTLQWDDPFYTVNSVDTDLDIFLLEPGTGKVLARSDDNNIENQLPSETFSFTNHNHSELHAEVVIRLSEGTEPGRIKYINYESGEDKITFNEFGTGSSTIVPHAAATNASAIGAVNYFDQDNPAYYPGKDPEDFFTSVGPTTILFEPKGERLEKPELRLKPELAAIQGVDTTFFGEDIDGNGFPNFFGTSAAAPHAAAIAALVKQANPDFTPEQIYERLESTAEDIYVSGRDNVTGFGLINAYDAVFGPVVAASPNFVDNFDNGDLPRRYAIDTNGAGRIRVTDSKDPLGSGQVVLDTFLSPAASEKLNPQGSLNELILNINADGASNVILTFDQKEFNDADDPMPDAFTGSFNADGVALSVDGKDWYRLVDLTGVNSTNVYNNNSVNLSEFAYNRGLTLGENVQIKFQQFGHFASPDGGFAFDNIFVTADTHKPHPHHCHELAVYA